MLGKSRKSPYDPKLAQILNKQYEQGRMMSKIEFSNNHSLIRTFHPVGQGAFYSERHFVDGKEFTIVYDCGSTSFKKEMLEMKIKSTFPAEQIIDILFLSHFHTDHINGLNILKNHYRIKKVILPYYDEEAKILSKINNFINDNNIDTSLIDDPIGFFTESEKETSVIFVDSDESPGTVNLERTTDISTFIPPDSNRIPSGKVFNLKDCSWYFIPFNYKQIERRNLFVKALDNSGLTLDQIDTVEKIIIHKKKIRDAYKSIEGDLNTTSMILFSGSALNVYLFFFRFNSPNNPNFNIRIRPSCIYLGDIDLNEKGVLADIEKKFINLLPNVGTIQIPHHGSVHNFNSSIIHPRVRAAIISYGKENKYGHPSDSVIGEITKKGAKTYLVSGDQHSIVVQTR